MSDSFQETILRVQAYLIKNYAPVAILFFGSRQRGEHKPNSDWDFYMIVPNDFDEVDDDQANLITEKARKDLGLDLDILFAKVDRFLSGINEPNSFARMASLGDCIYPDKAALLADYLDRRK